MNWFWRPATVASSSCHGVSARPGDVARSLARRRQSTLVDAAQPAVGDVHSAVRLPVARGYGCGVDRFATGRPRSPRERHRSSRPGPHPTGICARPGIRIGIPGPSHLLRRPPSARWGVCRCRPHPRAARRGVAHHGRVLRRPRVGRGAPTASTVGRQPRPTSRSAPRNCSSRPRPLGACAEPAVWGSRPGHLRECYGTGQQCGSCRSWWAVGGLW